MPNLLNLLAPLVRSATTAKAASLQGAQEGREMKRKTLLEDLAMQQQAEDRQRRTLMDELTMENIRSQMTDREADNLRASQPAPETFGTPFEAVQDGKNVFVERGNLGTTRTLEGYQPPPKVTTTAQGPARGTPEYNQMLVEEAKARASVAPARTTLPTEGERKAAAFYASGKQGHDTLEKLLSGDDPTTPEVEQAKNTDVPGWWAQQAAKVGFGAGNVMTNQQVRQMRQAALMLSDAWLRYTSGAAVPEQEVERFAESFIPRAGDDEATLAQKKQARATIIEALRKGAGRALNQNVVGQQPGPGDDLDAQINAVLGRQP